jgi:hypothetical protein
MGRCSSKGRRRMLNEFQPLNPLAVLFGAAIVGFSAFWDFHLPYQPRTLRYAVAPRRYFLGAGVYIGAYVILFLLGAGFLQPILLSMQQFIPAHSSEPHGIRQASLMLSVLVVTLLPHFPGISRLFASFRRFTHVIALYPRSIELLVTLLATSSFKARPDARAEIEWEFARYSVSQELLRATLSASALRLLEEAWSLHDCFGYMAQKGRAYKAFTAARQATIKKLEVELYLSSWQRIANQSSYSTVLSFRRLRCRVFPDRLVGRISLNPSATQSPFLNLFLISLLSLHLA